MTALTAELLPIALQLSRRFRGEVPLSGYPERVDCSGPGSQAAAQMAEHLVERRGIRHLILAGFSGGLAPALRAGEVVTPDYVLNESLQAYRLSGHVPSPATACSGKILLSRPVIASTPAEKQSLHARTGAHLVDVETFEVAAVSARIGLKLTVLRAISDPADTHLPVEAGGWVDSRGKTRVAGAATYALCRPWEIPSLVRLALHARRAGAALARATLAEMDRIVASGPAA